MIERIGQSSEKTAAIPTFELDEEDNQWKLEYCSTELEGAANINDSSTDWDFIQYRGTAATMESMMMMNVLTQTGVENCLLSIVELRQLWSQM